MSNASKVLVNLSTSPAFGYAILGVVVVVAFKVIHDALKDDVKETADKLSHPFGQEFDDTVQAFFDKILGRSPPSSSDGNDNAPPTTYPVPGSGDLNPNQW